MQSCGPACADGATGAGRSEILLRVAASDWGCAPHALAQCVSPGHTAHCGCSDVHCKETARSSAWVSACYSERVRIVDNLAKATRTGLKPRGETKVHLAPWHDLCRYPRVRQMRTLLLHAPTGQYFQSLERWTTTARKAHDFGDIGRAVRFVKKARFMDMELVLVFGDGGETYDSILGAAAGRFQQRPAAFWPNHA